MELEPEPVARKSRREAWAKTAMRIYASATPNMLAMPRPDDKATDMQEFLRKLAERVASAVMEDKSDQLCSRSANNCNRANDDFMPHTHQSLPKQNGPARQTHRLAGPHQQSVMLVAFGA